MSNDHIADFKQWVADNSRRRSPPAGPFASLGIQQLFLAADSRSPVVANSRLVGESAQSALSRDAEYVGLRGSPEGPELLRALPATGCAMVLTLAQRASGYNPASPAAADNLEGFLSYVDQLMACPVMNTTLHDMVDVGWSTDWNTSVNNILGYYQGIAASELETIRNSLWTIARAAASSPNTNQTENLFVQNTLNLDDSINVYIYKSYVVMREDRHSGSGKNAPTVTTNQTSLKLWRTVLNFDQQRWPDYAAIIAEQTDASLNSWLNDNSTPQGTVPVHWTC